MKAGEGGERVGDREAATATWLAADLLATGTTLVETHFAWVLIGPRDVWKVKKPIVFGDFDCTTMALRREACEAETRLNSEWAFDVYNGFVPITVDGRGRHRLGGPGPPREWAVHMCRLRGRDAADRRLAENRLATIDLERVAASLADFHRAAVPAVDPFGPGSPGALERNIRCHGEWAQPAVGHLISRAECQRIESRLLAFLDRHEKVFEARIGAGRVRDVHGDLRLDHVYIDRRRISIIDRLELGRQFRVADVAVDVAMLALGLEECGQMALATDFVTAYLRSADDPGAEVLIRFYASYCACRRACLLASLALDAQVQPGTRAQAAQRARRHFLLALSAADSV